jgi:hypothetical protein
MPDEQMLELGQTIQDEPSFDAPDGDYRFFVKGWNISMYQPKEGSKLPACKQVDVTLLIPYRDEEGKVVYGAKVEHFKLLARLKFAITNFFIACGLGKRGDEFMLDFDQCNGKVGTCKVIQQVGNNGNVYASIDEFYDHATAPQTALNDGMPFMDPQQQPQGAPQPQPQGQPNYGYGY